MKIADMIRLGAKGFKPSDIREIGESGMSTDDVLKLAENGYSVAEVKELITLSGSEEEVQPGNEGPTDPSGPADPPGNDGAGKSEDKIKALEAELQKQTDALKAAQAANSQRNLGAPETMTAREQVQEIFKNIY